jgi:hypothetical protein
MAYRVFKSSLRSCKYIFKDGTNGYFIDGRMVTDNEDHIAEMEHEIKHKHPTFFIDDKDSTSDTPQLDPMSALKKKIIEDYLKEQKEQAVKDMGNSDTSAGAGAGVGTTENTGTTAISPGKLNINLPKK